MLSDSRKKIIDHNKTRLRHVIKFVEFCGRQERIPKKQDGRLVGRTSSFRGEYSQLFFHKLSAFLDYSNHKQFFLFKAFVSIASAPPLEKSWLRPCSVFFTWVPRNPSVPQNIWWGYVSFKGSVRVPRFLKGKISCLRMLVRHCENF